MRTVRELGDLTGRVALVTGGAGHLGRVMAEALAEMGAAIALLDVDGDACERETKSIATRFDVRTLPLAIDLTDEARLRDVPAAVVGELGRLDILINNAALVGTSALDGWAVPFTLQHSTAWRRALEVNLTAPFFLVQEAAACLKASGRGAVINIGSTHGLVGTMPSLYEGTSLGSPGAYAASKAALIHLTRWLATVLAPHVRVNSISPGGVARAQPALFTERYEASTPLGRMASEEDFKGAVVYLASDLSAYVTGHNLVVDGGWTAW